MPKVIAVIPAYNEESRIGPVIRNCLNFVDAVVVVADGSVDGTAILAHQNGAHVLTHPINRGQGAAIQTATEYALNVLEADIIVHFDADGQMNPEEISEITAPLLNGEYDLVLGSRNLGRSPKAMPLSRKITLKLSLLFTQIVSGVRITDTHCGFRALTADAAKKMTITIDRMAHASQIYDLIKINNIRFTEVPVTITYTADTLKKGMKFSSGFVVLRDYFIHKLFG
jgi:glycosyltransferase involved in cell wall biosynthesis